MTRRVWRRVAARLPRPAHRARALRFLETHLASRTSEFTATDGITLAGAAAYAGQTVCGAAEREKAYPHVFAHYAKVTSDERIKALFGQPTFIDKPLSVE